MIIDGSLTPPVSEDEQRRIQGEAFVKQSGVPLVEDHTARVWYQGGNGCTAQSSRAPRPAQSDDHGRSVLEANK